jgi:hypothetical protein
MTLKEDIEQFEQRLHRYKARIHFMWKLSARLAGSGASILFSDIMRELTKRDLKRISYAMHTPVSFISGMYYNASQSNVQTLELELMPIMSYMIDIEPSEDVVHLCDMMNHRQAMHHQPYNIFRPIKCEIDSIIAANRGKTESFCVLDVTEIEQLTNIRRIFMDFHGRNLTGSSNFFVLSIRDQTASEIMAKTWDNYYSILEQQMYKLDLYKELKGSSADEIADMKSNIEEVQIPLAIIQQLENDIDEQRHNTPKYGRHDTRLYHEHFPEFGYHKYNNPF